MEKTFINYLCELRKVKHKFFVSSVMIIIAVSGLNTFKLAKGNIFLVILYDISIFLILFLFNFLLKNTLILEYKYNELYFRKVIILFIFLYIFFLLLGFYFSIFTYLQILLILLFSIYLPSLTDITDFTKKGEPK